MFDFKGRILLLQREMIKLGVDVTILLRPEHIYYFGGFWGFWPWRSLSLVIPATGEPTLICPAIESINGEAATWIKDVRVYVEWQANVSSDPFDMVGDVLREKGVSGGVIGIEETYLPARLYKKLESYAGSIVDVEVACEKLRSIKDSAEIEILRKGGQMVVAQAEAAVSAIAAGVPEYEISLAAKDAGTRKAAELLGPLERLFSPMNDGIQILTTERERGGWVHGRTSTYCLRCNDTVYMCFCMIANFRGYQIGFDRTATVGKPTEYDRATLQTVLDAQEAVFDRVRPGTPVSILDDACNGVLEKAGLLQYRRHRTGRGVGTAPVEYPIVTSTAAESPILQENMVLCISPGVYVPDVGNFHIGDTILVTSDGYDRLTPFERNLWNG